MGLKWCPQSNDVRAHTCWAGPKEQLARDIFQGIKWTFTFEEIKGRQWEILFKHYFAHYAWEFLKAHITIIRNSEHTALCYKFTIENFKSYYSYFQPPQIILVQNQILVCIIFR